MWALCMIGFPQARLALGAAGPERPRYLLHLACSLMGWLSYADMCNPNYWRLGVK
jgi:hypothetical protein